MAILVHHSQRNIQSNSKNLADSQSKLPVSMQRASKLAEMISPDVLAHMPNEK